MVRGRFKYFASCLLLIACLALSNISRAANLITTDGVAVITSKIDKKLFRTRAIENALQNLVSQGLPILQIIQELNSLYFVYFF